MQKRWQNALFIFRRDLRLSDNTGLIFASYHAKKVLCCFIFTPEQTKENPYKNVHCLQFMIESLEDLDLQLQGNLHLFYGRAEEVVQTCIEKLGIDAVVVNKDYTPYSRQRDSKIEAICKKSGVEFCSLDDALLHAPEQTQKKDHTPYTVFTPFFRNASKLSVAAAQKKFSVQYYQDRIHFAEKKSLYQKILPVRVLPVQGGRTFCMHILHHLPKSSCRKGFFEPTYLSAHLKFTTCSVREVYWALHKRYGACSDVIRGLYWREFFTLIALYFPHVFSGAFHQKFDKLHWDNDPVLFQKWCEGKTGFPLVDAGMRQMNRTGFMHNRVRMCVASFLVKDLHIDWRWGEKYFAKTLIDYDPCVNNGNWQWAASTGCDAQPYFRIFNPERQALQFDPDCSYIKQWIPELIDGPSKAVYPAPIVDHEKERKKSIAIYKSALY